MFVNIGDCIKFQGFLVEFLERTGDPEKVKTPRRPPEMWTFLSLAFYNAPSLHTVDSQKGSWKGSQKRFVEGS